MAEGLYSRDILRLAASLVQNDRLEHADARADVRAPLCGSHMTVEASFNGDMVSSIAISATACALGQASAGMVRKNAPGADVHNLISIREGLAAALAGDAEMPTDWPELGFFEPAQEHRSRHGAILLPFDALIECWHLARSKADA